MMGLDLTLGAIRAANQKRMSERPMSEPTPAEAHAKEVVKRAKELERRVTQLETKKLTQHQREVILSGVHSYIGAVILETDRLAAKYNITTAEAVSTRFNETGHDLHSHIMLWQRDYRQ